MNVNSVAQIASTLSSKGAPMFSTILFISIIVLIGILLALLALIVAEYRAKKSYDHYIMQSTEDKEESHDTYIRREREVSDRKPERTIPKPDYEKKMSTTGSSKEKEAKEQKDSIKESSGNEPLFKKLSLEEGEKTGIQNEIEEIRKKEYKPFTHDRLVKSMGLSPQEADEFVLELIHQLESAIVDLDEKIEQRDFEEIEHITHGLKGAALNIGSGGVADILIDYNTRMKEGSDIEAALAYQELLRSAVSDLKIEYSQVA